MTPAAPPPSQPLSSRMHCISKHDGKQAFELRYVYCLATSPKVLNPNTNCALCPIARKPIAHPSALSEGHVHFILDSPQDDQLLRPSCCKWFVVFVCTVIQRRGWESKPARIQSRSVTHRGSRSAVVFNAKCYTLWVADARAMNEVGRQCKSSDALILVPLTIKPIHAARQPILRGRAASR